MSDAARDRTASAPDDATIGGTSIWHVAVIATGLALIVFWYTPGVLYEANERQFFFPLLQVLVPLAVPLIVAVLVLALPAIVIPPRPRRFYAALLACVAAYAWVRGFLLVPDYGLLDGAIELPGFALAPLILSALLVVAASVMVARIRPAILAWTFAAFIVAQLTHLTVLTIVDPKPVRSVEPSRIGSLYELGPENVIVVLLDALQSDVFAEALEARPDLAAALDGYTYYPNTLGVAPTTYGSLPTIHSGRVRVPGESMDQFYRRSIEEESFETELARAGWKVTHVNPVAGVCASGIDSCFLYDPARRTSSRTRLLQQSAEMIDLALFRLAPPQLKSAVYDGNRWRLRRVFRSVSTQVSSDTALKDFVENIRRVGDVPTLKFLHLQSTHAPPTRSADCALLTESIPMTREAALDLATCALTRVAALTNKLRSLDMYDQTSLVLFADHGYNEMGSARVDDEAWTRLIGVANPLLAVKPAGATGALESSSAPMSLTDVRSLVCSLAGACEGDDTEWASGDARRPRRFMDYEWGDRFWLASTLKGERHYEVRGPLADPSSWTDLGPTSVPRISVLTFGPDDRAEHFGFGWRPVEGLAAGDGYRWGVGTSSSLNLKLPDDAETRLVLDVGTLPELADQRVALSVNGVKIATARVQGANDTITFVVPGEVADRVIDELTFAFAQHKDGGADADRHKRRARSLAVRFDELRISYGR